jgi:predicted helicase
VTSIQEVLAHLRAAALSEADKGARFERLVQAYLRVDPVFAEQFSDVWMWGEWPDNQGKHDTGIDLVAKDRNTGHLVAIQCKFFAPTTTVSKAMIDSFLSASGTSDFAERIVVSTTEKWGSNAELTIKNQEKPVRRIGLSDLEHSRVDWQFLDPKQIQITLELRTKKQPRAHQTTAIEKVTAGFGEHERGRLIMACGTGKTFTSLRLAEQNVGTVLFLVPSISLLSQSIREWVSEAELPIRALAVCSDAKSTKRSSNDEDISVTDLALPATTNVDVVRARLAEARADTAAMTVVFSTYQSIKVVAEALQGGAAFDLVICDEAHRTTGVTLADGDDSAFVRVHDNSYLPAVRRLYMTATPRIYTDASRTKAGEVNAVLASMDDPELYGPEMHRLGFGEAVERDLLTDYKVLVLAVDEESVARTFQQQLSDANSELQLDDAAKLVGCWNGLAKIGRAEHSFEPDTAPMRRAVAFAGSINDSKRVERLFTEITGHYARAAGLEEDGQLPLECQVQHVDGTFNALERNVRLDWLQEEPADNVCRILTNARCLSEGVDVPALDAVMFLSPRKSVVDIVQSVGRVMRKSPGKQFGYIILPIGIPAGMNVEQALADNKRYAAVWEVLQALRAHDERFDAMVNRIELTSRRDGKINVIGVTDRTDAAEQLELPLAFQDLDKLRDTMYAKIVAKVGNRRYWTEWAKSVADIATRQTTRIHALLNDPDTDVRAEFDRFLAGLRGNLNDGITESDAIDMLAQHLITRPVFDALFSGSQFLAHNPVARQMERMLAALDQHNVDDENRTLEKFYASVRMRVEGVDNAEGRQRIITELYDTFFSTAFKKTVDKLGIVYTPVEIVDFILRSADVVLRQEFGQGLTDEGVHILDPFTGTGTFMVRLLQLGLIEPHDLARKYAEELHANEILLLAYYIAAVNIETTYYDVMTSVAAPGGGRRAADPGHEYVEFPGLVLTDTFQSWEDDDVPDLDVFPENNERLEKLKKLPITVIVGNPPYSVGQDSANDDNQNDAYPGLDGAIRDTYAARSSASLLRNLYDSYVRAIKWATLRIQDRGVIGFVTNGGFLDSNAMDGMRKSLEDEFSSIYVLNLRGNQRTAGEQSRKEGGKVFGGGSRATVAITLLVRDPTKPGAATIHYTDIGDYLTAEQKLAMTANARDVTQMSPIRDIVPNGHGDWLHQRGHGFQTFVPLAGEGDGIFAGSVLGVSTNRDAWVIGSQSGSVLANAESLVANFNAALAERQSAADVSPAKVNWSRSLRARYDRGRPLPPVSGSATPMAYRPFHKQWLVDEPSLIEARGRTPGLFSVNGQTAIAVVRLTDRTPFTALMVAEAPSLNIFMDAADVYPRLAPETGGTDDQLDLSVDRSAITDEALKRFAVAYEDQLTKDDIFFYVYGLLHSPEYRETYAADLKKMLPRIPLVEDPWLFVDAGRRLSELHLGYESVTPYPLDGLDAKPTAGEDPYDFYRVQKMAFPKVRNAESNKLVADKTSVVYSSRITLSGIPEAAPRYQLGSRSAIEWIIDRYQVKTDKASGIVNDPNDWSRELSDPRYILDLLARIVTVSLETMSIVDALPALAIKKDQNPS